MEDWQCIGHRVNATEETPFISFQTEETRFYGTTGCNSFFGEFNTSDNKNEISLTNVGSTKKLCEDMTVEDAIFSAFSQVTSVNYDNDKMQLKNASGNVVMELSSIKK